VIVARPALLEGVAVVASVDGDRDGAKAMVDNSLASVASTDDSSRS
jgi:hypothetical protein